MTVTEGTGTRLYGCPVTPVLGSLQLLALKWGFTSLSIMAVSDMVSDTTPSIAKTSVRGGRSR